MTDRFDWTEDESVVLPQQLAVAVYLGEHGDIVIRQEGQYGISEDSFISLRPQCAVNICRAILQEAGLHAFKVLEIGFSENELIGRDGNLMHVPKSERDRFDPVTGELLDSGGGKDPTAAERKRRQRAREREAAAAADTVTRDSHTVTPRSETPQPQQSLLRLAHG